MRESSLLPRAQCGWRVKPARAEATQVRHDHVRTAGRQPRRDVVEATGTVGEAMQEDDRPARPVAVPVIGDLDPVAGNGTGRSHDRKRQRAARITARPPRNAAGE